MELGVDCVFASAAFKTELIVLVVRVDCPVLGVDALGVDVLDDALVGVAVCKCSVSYVVVNEDEKDYVWFAFPFRRRDRVGI